MRISDWSSDVCSSDLLAFFVVALVDRLVSVLLAVEDPGGAAELLVLHAGHLHDGALGRQVAAQADDAAGRREGARAGPHNILVGRQGHALELLLGRSEERRVGKEWVRTGR